MSLLIVVSLMLSIIRCEEEVISVMDTGRPFTLFGLFTPELDTQWVRIFSIDKSLVQRRLEPLDAHVTSTDLHSGEMHIWKDSLLQEQYGDYSHVFWAPFRAVYGHTYILEAVRSDGVISHAEVEVPVEAQLVVEEPYSVGFVYLPVFVQGEVPRLLRIEVEYRVHFLSLVLNDNLDVVGREREKESVVLSSLGRQRKEAGGWHILLNLTEDRNNIRGYIIDHWFLDHDYGLVLENITLRVLVTNEEWDPPGDLLDPEILVQPGAMSNVENGFGFIGAGYRLRKEWLPSQEWLERAGFSN